MATLSIKTVTLSDANPSVQAADAAGDQVLADADTALIIENDDVSSVDVTLASQLSASPGLAAANLVISVPAGAQRIVSFAKNLDRFKDSNGYVQISYASVTSLNIAAFKLG